MLQNIFVLHLSFLVVNDLDRPLKTKCTAGSK